MLELWSDLPTRNVCLPRSIIPRPPSAGAWLDSLFSGATSCASCAGAAVLDVDAVFGDVAFCAECRELAATPADDAELGGGD